MLKFKDRLSKFAIVTLMNVCFIYSSVAIEFDELIDKPPIYLRQIKDDNDIFEYNQNIALPAMTRKSYIGWDNTVNEYAGWLRYIIIGATLSYLVDLADAQTATLAPAPPTTANSSFNPGELTFYLQLATLSITAITLCFGAGKFCIEHVDRDWNAVTGYNITAFIRNLLCGICCMCFPNRMLQHYRLPMQMPEPDLELGEGGGAGPNPPNANIAADNIEI